MKSEPIILPASRMGQVEEYYFSRKLKEIASLRAEGKKVINLGIGSPDQAPDEEVIQTLIRESSKKEVHGYQSYLGLPELRQAFSMWYKKYFKVDLNPNTEILGVLGLLHNLLNMTLKEMANTFSIQLQLSQQYRQKVAINIGLNAKPIQIKTVGHYHF